MEGTLGLGRAMKSKRRKRKEIAGKIITVGKHSRKESEGKRDNF